MENQKAANYKLLFVLLVFWRLLFEKFIHNPVARNVHLQISYVVLLI